MDDLIELALTEDVGPGDWTTEWTVDANEPGEAVVVGKESLVVAGTEVASAVFRRVDPGLTVDVVSPDGMPVEAEGEVMRVRGFLRGILTGERVALNFLGRLSGIATLTRRYVDAVSGTGARILDTRKTTPGWRMLEKAAVKAGGGGNHRLGLFDMVMAKDNHLVAAGGLKEAVRRIRTGNRVGLEVEVEVDTLEQLDELLPFGVDRVLLDNMDLATLREAVRRIRAVGKDRPLSEASGNVTLETVRNVAETGVDFISVGALTHSAPRSDLSLRVLRGKKL
jgi:nicotinate-nucleotide pyrophosphorylase (carboxylating)